MKDYIIPKGQELPVFKTLTDEEIEEIIDDVIDAMGISYAACCVRRDGWAKGVEKFRELLRMANQK